MAERIAKVIARSGLCSRREAEAWIAAGRISLNGSIITSPACNVTEEDNICVDGAPLPAADVIRIWMFHKPKGCITSHKDPQQRTTIFDLLPADMKQLKTVGRLDFNTEGLLLLTNSGALARHMELPKTGWKRRYRVRALGQLDPRALEALKKGLTLTDPKSGKKVSYGKVEATVEEAKQKSANMWLSIAIHEGKNREVRNICAHLGLKVNRLIRIAFGPFQLGKLPAGEVKEVPPRVWKEWLGNFSEVAEK